jgi:hypothetical protein
MMSFPQIFFCASLFRFHLLRTAHLNIFSRSHHQEEKFFELSRPATLQDDTSFTAFHTTGAAPDTIASRDVAIRCYSDDIFFAGIGWCKSFPVGR